MKSWYRFFSTVILLLLFVTNTKAQTIRVATYNIKYDDKHDKVNNWEVRKTEVAELIRYHQFEVFGVQEALYHQLQDLQKELPDFTYVGSGRDDGKQKGEFSALFYKKATFEVLASGTFWLSESPNKPSKSWDAALPRICTWAQLKHTQTQKEFAVFNTHFDHRGVEAREESAKVILNQVSQLVQGTAIILIGDFNFEPNDTPYSIITKSMSDSYKHSEAKPYGPKATFNAFHFDKLPEKRIDYIFTSGSLRVMTYATLTDSREMRYPSDHFPVVTDIRLN